MIDNWIDQLSTDELHILSIIQTNGIISRSQVLEFSPFGISKTDMIVKNLMRSHCIDVKESNSAKKGRSPHNFSVNPNLSYFVGADLNFVHDQLVLMDFSGQKIASKRMEPSYRHDSIPDMLHKHIELFIESSGIPRRKVQGIGIGLHGIIDRYKGMLHFRPELGRTIHQEISRPVQKKMGIPTVIAQPKFFRMVNSFRRGDYANQETVVSINLGHGVGMGVAFTGLYYLGVTGVAGQIGHMKIPGCSTPCYCGNTGCLVTRISYEGICRDTLKRINSGFFSSIDKNRLEGPDFEAGTNHIIDHAVKNDKLAINVVHDVSLILADMLSQAVTILNPSLITVNTDLVRTGDMFCGSVKLMLQKITLKESIDNLEIRFSPSEPEAVAEGAAYHVLRSFMHQRELTNHTAKQKLFTLLMEHYER